MSDISGIYQIKNIIDNNLYVGSSKNIYKRWNEHKRSLKKEEHHNPYLQRIFNIYGLENLEFKILLVCESFELLKYEQWFLDKLEPEYNLCKIAGNTMGRLASEETRQKMSLASKGKPKSEETKVRMGVWQKGVPKSEETKQKISKTRIERGIVSSPETIAKQILANTGQKRSEETKLKMSLSAKGRTFSEETRLKMSLAQKGSKHPNRKRRTKAEILRDASIKENNSNLL